MLIDFERVLAGNRRDLARAITLVESRKEADRERSQQLLERVMPHTGKSFRIGITGVPGVGKSTFIESFGMYLVQQGKKVAVLAVDPSSPISGGSILGDKTRMEALAREPAYEAVATLARCPDFLHGLQGTFGADFSIAQFLAELDDLRAAH